ncbi:hypothetical protein IL306_006111 [Fusarium sp. DS 682]|nr:hypothetical protein IL306_006111 [Fusarium sp. DS 682]
MLSEQQKLDEAILRDYPSLFEQPRQFFKVLKFDDYSFGGRLKTADDGNLFIVDFGQPNWTKADREARTGAMNECARLRAIREQNADVDKPRLVPKADLNLEYYRSDTLQELPRLHQPAVIGRNLVDEGEQEEDDVAEEEDNESDDNGGDGGGDEDMAGNDNDQDNDGASNEDSNTDSDATWPQNPMHRQFS